MGMVDVCIVGAGLSGIAAAHKLISHGKSVAVFDARTRVGGRLLTAEQGGGDLGGAWIWPRSEYIMQKFVSEVAKVETVPMHVEGETLARTRDGRRQVLPDGQAVRYSQFIIIILFLHIACKQLQAHYDYS